MDFPLPALSHGRSFNRFCNGVLGYQGPTILLIRTKTGAVLGAYSTSGITHSFVYHLLFSTNLHHDS